MKKIILNLVLIITTVSFAQHIDTENFKFEESEIEYNRIDYSKYGVSFLILFFCCRLRIIDYVWGLLLFMLTFLLIVLLALFREM